MSASYALRILCSAALISSSNRSRKVADSVAAISEECPPQKDLFLRRVRDSEGYRLFNKSLAYGRYPCYDPYRKPTLQVDPLLVNCRESCRCTARFGFCNRYMGTV